MSNRFWIKLSKGDILANMEILGLYKDNVKANKLLKELNYCLKHIETYDKVHKHIYGKRIDNRYKQTSFINGLNYAKNLLQEDSKEYKELEKEIKKFEQLK